MAKTGRNGKNEEIIKGVPVPSIGLGKFGLTGDHGDHATRSAIEAGYRHIDTAIRYGNEKEVGSAIRESGVARGELFVTTRIWFDNLAPEDVAPARKFDFELDEPEMKRIGAR